VFWLILRLPFWQVPLNQQPRYWRLQSLFGKRLPWFQGLFKFCRAGEYPVVNGTYMNAK
jgi:hypothetical protein